MCSSDLFFYTFGTHQYSYPHNLFFEVAAEQGIVGILILFFVFCVIIYRLRSILRFRSKYVISLFALWIFALLNALVSMDLSGNYYFWIFGGLFWFVNTDLAQEKINYSS